MEEKTKVKIVLYIWCALLVIMSASAVFAQPSLQAQIGDKGRRVVALESKLAALESEVLTMEVASLGTVLFIIGTICALWAQNTGKNAWLWFFCGVFFTVFTLAFLLFKNANRAKEVSTP